MFGPALQLNDQLLKWEGEAGERRDDVGDDDIGTRVLFKAGIHESVSSHLLLVNCGTAAVYYNWKVCTLYVYHCTYCTVPLADKCVCVCVCVRACMHMSSVLVWTLLVIVWLLYQAACVCYSLIN